VSRRRNYQDLFLELRDLDDATDTFSVAVLPSPGVGETQSPSLVPYGIEGLREDLEALRTKSIGQESLISLGERLAERLLPPGQVRDLFQQALRAVDRNDGVRLRLLIRDHRLAQIPWEFTYLQLHRGEKDLRHFLARNPQISIVRHEALPEKHPRLSASRGRTLRLLAAMASPEGHPALDLQLEKKVIEEALGNFHVDGVSIDWRPVVEDATWSEVAAALQQRVDLFHFAGHGSFDIREVDPHTQKAVGEGYIVLMRDKQTKLPDEVPAGDLALHLQKAGVRVAVLSSCQSAARDEVSAWTGVAPALIERGIPAVVAMQHSIVDESAIAFSEMFYSSLARGLSVDEAVSAGRLAKLGRSHEDTNFEWGVPVLYLRSTDGVLFPDLIQQDSPEGTDRRNLKLLLDKVNKSWVEGVLEKSVHNSELLELGLQDRPDAVEDPWQLDALEARVEKRELSTGGISDLFAENQGSLLILGAPGSGKTLTMLRLARDLVARAESDPAQPVPVVFPLSSWSAKKYQDLTDWLVDELNTKYHIPKEIGRSWIEATRLTLLLDGLDEVHADDRTACVEAINVFHKKYISFIVVSSRLREYDELTVRLNLGGAIVIRPLTPAQISDSLSAGGPASETLSTRLQQEPALRELARTPLMLSVMKLAYEGFSAGSLSGKNLNSPGAWKKYLFNHYIEHVPRGRGGRSHYAPEQTTRWLSWLAIKLLEHGQTVFQIEQMQPSWLSTRGQRWMYAVVSRLVVGVIIGFALAPFGSMESLPAALLVGLIGGIAIGCVTGFRFGLSGTPATRSSLPYERTWIGVLIVGLGSGIVLGLGAGLVKWKFSDGAPLDLFGQTFWQNGLLGGLLFAVSFGPQSTRKRVDQDIQIVEAIRWSGSGLLAGALLGLLLAVIIAVFSQFSGDVSSLPALFLDSIQSNTWLVAPFFVALGALVLGVRHNKVEKRTFPNQGVWRSARIAVLFGLLIGPFIGMLLFPAVEYILGSWRKEASLSQALIIGAVRAFSFGAVIGVWYGGLTFIQHFTLRSILCFQKLLPWKYSIFLDHAVDRVLLQRVGGGYIFIHRLLLEHFAELPAREEGER